MIREIKNRLYKINTYANSIILEVDDTYDEEVKKLLQELKLDILGYRLNLLVKLAELSTKGYAIASVTEFNIDGSKPKVAYTSDKNYKKLVKYYLSKK